MLQTTLKKKNSANYLFNGIITIMVVATVAKIKLALSQGHSGVNLTPHRTWDSIS